MNIGFNIASRAKELVPVAPFAAPPRTLNGSLSGSLKEEEIRWNAGYLAPAHSTPTNDRPYHKGVRRKRSKRQEGAGKQFDPYVVDKFIEIVTKKRPKRAAETK